MFVTSLTKFSSYKSQALSTNKLYQANFAKLLLSIILVIVIIFSLLLLLNQLLPICNVLDISIRVSNYLKLLFYSHISKYFI